MLIVTPLAVCAVRAQASYPNGSAPAAKVPEAIRPRLYAIYNSTAPLVVRLHAWSVLRKIDASLPRPDFAGRGVEMFYKRALVSAAAGGTVTRGDGASVSVPAGVLSADATVSISTPEASAEAGRAAAAQALGLAAAGDEIDFSSGGVAFKRGVEIALPVPSAWQSQASRLQLWCWQAPGRWGRLPALAEDKRQAVSTRVLSLTPCRLFAGGR